MDKLYVTDKQQGAFRALRVEHDDAMWHHDSPEEFFADYRKYQGTAYLSYHIAKSGINLWANRFETTVWVEGTSRSDIESVYSIFESAQASCRFEVPANSGDSPRIFIGHGRNAQWRDLKDHLHEKHGFNIEAYETGARAGHAIRDILEEMVKKSSFAIIVLTGEDQQEDGSLRARENAVHEAGLFQGRLGYSRAILLLEAGVEEFSNVHGIQHIRFSQSNIKETFGEVLATLRREFGG